MIRRVQMLRQRRWWLLSGAVILTLYIASAVYQVNKPLPAGVKQETPMRAVQQVDFLADMTWRDDQGNLQSKHVIFDEMLRIISEAQQLVVIDMFLFNDFAGTVGKDHRSLSRELSQALIRQHQQVPDIDIIVITDPLNTLYGGMMPKHFRAMKDTGVSLIITDLSVLRSPNPAWTGLWNLCCRWLGNSQRGGWLPNPVGSDPLTLRSYLRMLNFKANHRKTLVADSGEDWVGLVTSANAHDASSRHSNVALRFTGQAALDLLETERAVTELSGKEAWKPPAPITDEAPLPEGPHLQILTEGAIREALMEIMQQAQKGSMIDIAVFYFAHRPLLEATIAAHQRGASIRVLLDANNEAFGFSKNGIPNRQIAIDLHRAGIPIRWCATSGEQCHSKFLLSRNPDGTAEMVLGSANFTRSNLDNFNLETSVRLMAPSHQTVIKEATAFFQRQWHNQGGQFSLPYEANEDTSLRRYWLYRFTEASGLSTF